MTTTTTTTRPSLPLSTMTSTRSNTSIIGRVVLLIVCSVVAVPSLINGATTFTGQQPVVVVVTAFQSPSTFTTTTKAPKRTTAALRMAQVSQAEAQKSIDKVVQALRKDSAANSELGRLTKVNNVLGFGSPTPDAVNVRFNASFQKSGKGLSSVPLPFGLGQSNKSEGRGTMVGQVKASVSTKTGKIITCSVFRDLGYGRSFNLKV